MVQIYYFYLKYRTECGIYFPNILWSILPVLFHLAISPYLLNNSATHSLSVIFAAKP